jgi:hypothetical protein
VGYSGGFLSVCAVVRCTTRCCGGVGGEGVYDM